jgi:hypothetical protein
MVALAKLSAGILGQATFANGFTCTPTGPASLNVLLTPGEIYQMENLEQTVWSSLPADLVHSILKQGILLNAIQFGITPPGTTGFSQVFLIEVQYQDLDSGLVTLPYFNAGTPSSPFMGPGNSGTAQNTVRQGIVATQVKAGIAASTGTQVAPTADAGWTGLYLVTVANGQATITAGNIVPVLGAPFFPTLPSVPGNVQNCAWIYGADASVTPGSIVVTPGAAGANTPAEPYSSYTAGMQVLVKAANATATTPGATVAVMSNGLSLGTAAIINPDGSAIQPGQWAIGSMLWLTHDGFAFRFMSPNYKQPGQQLFLQGAKTLYVNASTGSDTLYDGSASTVSGSHGPFATLQRAVTEYVKYNLNGNNITVNVANGSYANVTLSPVNGSGSIIWIGNTGTPSSVVVTGTAIPAIYAPLAYGTHSFSGFTLATSGSTINYVVAGLYAFGGGVNVTLSNMQFNSNSDCHICASYGTLVALTNSTYVINGGCAGGSIAAGVCLFATNGGIISQPPGAGPIFSIPGAVTFNGFFVQAVTLGLLTIQYASLTGAANVTGARYNANTNAIIGTGGGGANYWPGTIAGTQGTGGQYT